MATTHQLLIGQQPHGSHLSYKSATLIFDAYLPAALVIAVLLLRAWPKSSTSSPTFLSRLFASFVGPEDVHEYDRQEAQAREQDKQIFATSQPAGPATTGQGVNSYGSTVDGKKKSSIARAPEAALDEGDSETSPLLGSGSRQDISVRSDKQPKQPTGVRLGLSVINLAHLLTWVAALVLASSSSRIANRIGSEAGFQNAEGLRLAAALQIVGWMYAAIQSCFFPSPTPPYDLLIFYALQLAGSTVSAYHSLFDVPHPPLSPPHRSQLAPPLFSIFSFVLTLLGSSLIMSLPLQVYDRNPQHDRNGYPPPLEDYCTLWQWLSFSWLNPIINDALARPLEETDVSQLSKLSKAKVLLNNMRRVQRIDDEKYAKAKEELDAVVQHASAQERKRAEARAEKKKPNILRQIFWMNSRDLSLDFVLTLVSYSLAYASPFFLKQILEALQGVGHKQAFAAERAAHAFDQASTGRVFTTMLAAHQQGLRTGLWPFANLVYSAGDDSIDPAKKRAFVFALLALLASAIKTQTDLQHLYYSRRASVRIKSELTLAIYEKALRRKDVSGSTLNATSTAETQPTDNKDDGKTPKDADSAKKGTATADDDDSAASVGKVVNLMSTDANYVSLTVTSLYQGYSAPLELAIATTFLYKLLGWSAFVGIGPAIVLMPLQQRATVYSYANNKELLKARDKRVTVLNELITSIRFIKFFAWERGWSERVLRARQDELKLLYRNVWIITCMFCAFALVPVAFTITAFASYTLIEGKKLDIATSFTAIALFAMLRGPLGVLPMIINMILQAKVSMDRINSFLQEKEVPAWVVENCNALTGSNEQADDATLDRTIVLQDATLRWHDRKPADKPSQAAKRSFLSALKFWKKAANPAPTAEALIETEGDEDRNEAEVFHLTAINFRPPPGRMTLVCGPTGSGKSSLLSAILGEMELLEGSITLPKRQLQLLSAGVAYCSQTAWLETMSIRDNIVFGQYFDKDRYAKVLDCCCLAPDLKTFPDSDQTEVGENGVSLSGGQKARVALARAVYSRAPVLILDDVLAAVDSHTARRLVDECLRGDLVAARTVVLVTHHVELVLPHVSHIVMLEEGRIRASGSPAELKAEGLLSKVVHESSMPTDTDSKGKQAAKDELVQEEAKDAAVDAQAQASGKAEPAGKDKTDIAASGRGKLVTAEGKATGSVKREIFVMYLSAFGWFMVSIVVIVAMSSRVADVLEKYWLSFWGSAYEMDSRSHAHGWFPDPNKDVVPYLVTYTLILLVGFATMILSFFIGGLAAVQAGSRLFKRMLKTVVRSPTRFFDSTPTGKSTLSSQLESRLALRTSSMLTNSPLL